MTSIIEIGNILVSSAIFTEQFICDYAKCKGECCISGDSGAPLEEEECRILERELDEIKSYMTTKGLESIEIQGPFVIDSDGDLVTPLNSGAECSYSFFEGDNFCMCAIERANRDGRTSLRKPLSCWLYPIRVSKLSNGMIALNMHQWHICLDAFAKGKREGVPVFRFLREPLTFAFGEEFYNSLEEAYEQLFSDKR